MVVATRCLRLRSSSDKTIDVSIDVPEIADGMWICRYNIGWPDRARDSYAAGVDSMQAIHHALQKIGMELYISPYHLSGDLIWEKAGDGYGFPVPKDGRDLLVGSDRVFDG